MAPELEGQRSDGAGATAGVEEDSVEYWAVVGLRWMGLGQFAQKEKQCLLIFSREAKMMTTMKAWLASNIGSSGWLLLAPLLAAYAQRGLPQMYFNLHLRRHVRRLLPFLDPFVTIDIVSQPNIYISRIKSSEACGEVKAYLSAICSRDALELRAEGAVEGDGFVFSLREGQEVVDEFHGVTVWWSSVLPGSQDRAALVQGHCIRLTFHRQHRELIMYKYMPHVRRSGRVVMVKNRRRRIYTNKKNLEYVALQQRPPQAPHGDNSKSIIVIEDIDCSLDLTGQRSDSGALPVHSGITSDSGKKRKRTSVTTLSGLLNFTDGIWSAADKAELIIVFTTNFLDKLDPALIRRGRMDMHVEMSYCCFEAFTTLAKNYLGVDEHPLFDTVNELLQSVEITPADVAECLMTSEGTGDGADACLGFLIKELNKKKAEVDRNTEVAQEEIPATPNGKGSSCVDEHPLFKNV
ncbi:hypothetical protein PR202_gb12565 [Eleusine coracana subsp. coracana]|uniref:Uncharacterized protein n=1 Tax=Eleusine coracana subsp. coracana TaxID=191504 RepID=A0AAV5EQ74_ELECO|nr:hypothetical protein PR202_gb12565 [Eleusine coracana subsp. coracana]